MLKGLSTLPDDNRYYLVHAIGNLCRNPSSNINQLLQIVLSPEPTPTRDFSPRLILANRSSELRKSYISLGEMFLYHPGCLIKNGNVISRPKPSNFSKFVEFLPDNMRFVDADHKIPAGGKTRYLISPSDYRLNIALSSKLLCVERDGDPYALMIPTIEVIRHFYSGSSKLTQAIFSPDILDIENFVNLNCRENTEMRSTFSDTKRELSLVLRKDYTNDDACLIGHWFADKYAYTQAKSIYKSLLMNEHSHNEQVNNQRSLKREMYNFEVIPPFRGKIHLSGYGVSVANPNDSEKPRFLMLSINNTSNYLPFNALLLDRDNSNVSSDDNNDKSSYTVKPTAFAFKKKIGKRSPKGKNNPFKQPDSNTHVETIVIQSNRFSQVSVIPATKKKTTHRPHPNPFYTNPAENQSTSEGSYGNSSAIPINISPNEIKKHLKRRDPTPADFENFKLVCAYLENTYKVKCSTKIINPINIICDSTIETRSSFPIFDHAGNVLSWSLIERGSESLCVRQADIVEVTSRHGIHYLLEVERAKNRQGELVGGNKFAIYVFSNSKCEPLSPSTLSTLLADLAYERFQLYKQVFSNLGLNVMSRRHSGTTESCASGLLERCLDLKISGKKLYTPK